MAGKRASSKVEFIVLVDHDRGWSDYASCDFFEAYRVFERLRAHPRSRVVELIAVPPEKSPHAIVLVAQYKNPDAYGGIVGRAVPLDF